MTDQSNSSPSMASGAATASERPNHDPNQLVDLGEMIFLDRYAVKDVTRTTLGTGDTVIVLVDPKSHQREIGKVLKYAPPEVEVELRDGTRMTVSPEQLDKPVETRPQQLMDRVARGIAAVETTAQRRAEWQRKFRGILEGWKFVPAGRILTAAGTEQHLTYYNCYVIPSPTDSRAGIFRALSQMTEIMSRGGGVGINLSSLRPKHSYVRGVNGRSSGAVSWGAVYSFVTGLIEQGGSRRGALMLILNDWHPDVMSFITSKRQMGQITNANISVAVSDALMAAVKADGDWELVFPDTTHPEYDTTWNGNLAEWRAAGRPVVHYKTVKAREIWAAIIESAWASAEPGVFFVDRYNAMSNSWYYAPIFCTNPCVTGDTLIYTGEGLVRARELFEQGGAVDAVVDGRFGHPDHVSPASAVFRTGTKPVYRLRTKEGYSLRATADHRVMTPGGWVELRRLRPGDTVHILNRKGGFGAAGTLDLGRSLGWLIGDGTLRRKEAVLSFFGAEKQELAPMFAAHVGAAVAPITVAARTYPQGVSIIAGRDEARVQSQRLKTLAVEYGLDEEKVRVPEVVFKGSEQMQRGFLQALFTADGSFQDGGEKGGSVRLASSSLGLLEGVQHLLLNFGIASRIYRERRAAGERPLPDGHGGLKAYWCEAQHELAVSKENLIRFADEIGFLMAYKQDGLVACIGRLTRGPYAESFTATVESVSADGIEDVYDLTEPLTHSFVGNGFVLHNCGEQGLPSWGVCNLGAVNLAKFHKDGAVDWEALGQTIRYAVRFLDNVIEATPYFFDENREQQLKERRVGLNTMGVAELLIRLGIRYGSEESLAFLDRLYEFIAINAYEASIELAKERGPFPAFDAEQFLQSGFMRSMPQQVREAVARDGIRNVTLLTQAPNGTIGTMVGTSTGVEPFYSWTYFRKSRLGMQEQRVAVVQEWQEAHPGEALPEHFVNAMDLAPEEHVRVEAAIQRWIDSSISKTCNVPNEYSVDQVRELYELMYELGCKGGTIYRDGSRDEQVLIVKKDEPLPAQASEATRDGEKLFRFVHAVEPLPERRAGVTVTTRTPLGTVHVTSNHDESGEPFEVFITIGKAGSDLQADAEALGRLISLQLRIASPLSRRERLQLVISQLEGIGGARSVGLGPNRVLSLSDAVAMVLRKIYFAESPAANGAAHTVPHSAGDAAQTGAAHHANGTANGKMPRADLCPACGMVSFIHEEGCRVCVSCGHSEC